MTSKEIKIIENMFFILAIIFSLATIGLLIALIWIDNGILKAKLGMMSLITLIFALVSAYFYNFMLKEKYND